MNKVEVIQVFEDAIKNSNKFIGLMIEKEGAGPEISIIPDQNFIRKKTLPSKGLRQQHEK